VGDSKKRGEDERHKENAAVEIAVMSGFLNRCGGCEGVTKPYLGTDDNKEKGAYKLANKLFTDGDILVRDFKDSRELTDLIKTLPDTFDGKCGCSDKKV